MTPEFTFIVPDFPDVSIAIPWNCVPTVKDFYMTLKVTLAGLFVKLHCSTRNTCMSVYYNVVSMATELVFLCILISDPYSKESGESHGLSRLISSCWQLQWHEPTNCIIYANILQCHCFANLLPSGRLGRHAKWGKLCIMTKITVAKERKRFA